MTEAQQNQATTMSYEDAAFAFLIGVSVIGMIYTGLLAIFQNVSTNLLNDDYQQKKRIQKQAEDTFDELVGADKNIADEHLEYAQVVLNRIDDALVQLYVLTSLYVLLFAMILISFCAFIFMPNSKTALSFIFAFMYGVGVVCVITFIVLKFTTGATGQIMIKSFETRGDGAKFAYIVGNIVSIFSTCLMVFVFSLVIYFTHMNWNVSAKTGEKIEFTQIMYVNMIHSLAGYCMGICFAALFYREVNGQSCRGIIVGSDLVGTLDRTTEEDRHIDTNFQMASIVSETFTNNLIQSLDNLSVTAALIGSTLIIISQVPSLVNGQVNGHSVLLYSYMLFLVIFVPLQMGISWIFFVDSSDEYRDRTVSSLTGGNVSHGDAIWCMMIGLILQTILVCFGEYLTSHSFQATRDMAKEARENFGYGLIVSNIFGSYAYYSISILLAFFILITYSMAGFIGVSLCALGLISSQILYNTINFMGGICTNGYKFSKITQSYGVVIDRIYKFSWASRNFAVYSQILNTGGIFLVNIVSIGGILVLSKVTQIWLWSGFTLFGFFIGSAVAYFLKGGCVSIVKAVALETYKEFKYFEGSNQYTNLKNQQQSQDPDKIMERNIDKEDRLTQFMENKFNIGILRVMINIIVCVVSILIVGLLLGGESVFGYILGLNIVGLQITVMQIIMGNQIRSIADYNENLLTGSKDKQGQQNTREIKSYAISIESIPGSALISYLSFNTMFILIGSLTFGRTGILRDWIERYVSYIPEDTIIPVAILPDGEAEEVEPREEGGMDDIRSSGYDDFDDDDEWDDGKGFEEFFSYF